MDDIIALLEADHRKVKSALKKLDSDSAGSTREKGGIFADLARSLVIHMAFEEKSVYPILIPNRASKNLAYEAFEEHKQVKVLLAAIAKEATYGDVWKAKVQVLGEGLRHHIREEESSLLPKLRTIAGRTTLDRLGAAYATVTKRAQA